ncbi:MAG: phage head-tail connector protein [Planctomycetes bacterium]|nr:phage head-tail connector protein [Planctomycetota bacterium]
MSTTTITVTIVIDGEAREGLTVVLSDATGTYGVKRNDTDAVVVADGTAMTDAGAGRYTYTFDDPAADLTYTAAIEYAYDGETYRQTGTIAGGDGSTLRACCTLASVKSRLELTDSAADTMLEEIIAGVTAELEAYCRRKFVRPTAAVTAYFDGDANPQAIPLEYFPAVVITSVTESLDHDHDNATALTADDGYWLNDHRGMLYPSSLHNGGRWLRGVDAVRVVYLGGYTPAGVALGAGEIAMPDKVVEAAVRQSCYVYHRRRERGLQAVSGPDGGVTAYATDELLPDVKALLAEYRRISIA